MKKYEIFGIGNALVDIECRIDLKELESFELRKGFMTLVSAPKQGELLSSNHLKSKDIKHLKQFLEQERNQPVNVVYDAGGGQEQVMKDVHQIAKEAGFNTTLVYVRTPLDVAQQRNQQRPRSLPSDMVAQYHQNVKHNIRNMIPIFDNV